MNNVAPIKELVKSLVFADVWLEELVQIERICLHEGSD